MNSCTRPLIIAHRGASHQVPENTLAAFKKAWQEGADAIECDIRLSADRRIMVCHDPDTMRTAGAARIIAETTSSDLRTLDVGGWKSHRFHGERIPFLAEVLAAVPRDGRILIELKEDGGLAETLLAELPDHAASFCTLIGFDPDILRTARRLFPGFSVLWLIEHSARTPLDGQADWRRCITRAADEGFDGLDVRFTDITEPFARAVHDAGLDLWAWTVNDAGMLGRLMEMGISGITTDRPGAIRRALGRIGANE